MPDRVEHVLPECPVCGVRSVIHIPKLLYVDWDSAEMTHVNLARAMFAKHPSEDVSAKACWIATGIHELCLLHLERHFLFEMERR